MAKGTQKQLNDSGLNFEAQLITDDGYQSLWGKISEVYTRGHPSSFSLSPLPRVPRKLCYAL